jgi:hypothetical protein
VRTHPPVRRQRRRRTVDRDLLAVGLAVVLTLAVGAAIPWRPGTVHRLTIRNDTVWDLDVALSRGPSDPAPSPLPIARAGASVEVPDVLDQGDRWVVVFRSAGTEVGRVDLSRARLAGAGWNVAVPGGVTERLEAAGVPATPP